MKCVRGILSALLLLLTGCNQVVAPVDSQETRAPAPVSSTQNQNGASPITSSAVPTAQAQLSDGWQTVEWQDLTISVPPQHLWQPVAVAPSPSNSVPVLAQAHITFDRTLAAPDAVELPDGIRFSILDFDGSLDQWLTTAQDQAPAQNPIDTNMIRQETIAGRPALVYSYTVTGVSNSATYVLRLTDDQLLVIETSDIGNPSYQRLLDTLKIQ